MPHDQDRPTKATWKLTWDQVRAIRAYAEAHKDQRPGVIYAALAPQYGVALTTIQSIVLHDTWPDPVHREQTLARYQLPVERPAPEPARVSQRELAAINAEQVRLFREALTA